MGPRCNGKRQVWIELVFIRPSSSHVGLWGRETQILGTQLENQEANGRNLPMVAAGLRFWGENTLNGVNLVLGSTASPCGRPRRWVMALGLMEADLEGSAPFPHSSAVDLPGRGPRDFNQRRTPKANQDTTERRAIPRAHLGGSLVKPGSSPMQFPFAAPRRERKQRSSCRFSGEIPAFGIAAAPSLGVAAHGVLHQGAPVAADPVSVDKGALSPTAHLEPAPRSRGRAQWVACINIYR